MTTNAPVLALIIILDKIGYKFIFFIINFDGTRIFKGGKITDLF